MNTLITCRHVDFGYENHDAVIDLTMEVNEGDYLCVVGFISPRRPFTSVLLPEPLAPTTHR